MEPRSLTTSLAAYGRCIYFHREFECQSREISVVQESLSIFPAPKQKVARTRRECSQYHGAILSVDVHCVSSSPDLIYAGVESFPAITVSSRFPSSIGRRTIRLWNCPP